MPRESIAADSPIARMMESQIDLILQHKALESGSAVLEIGCAEGYFLERLAGRAPGITLTGIEPSRRYAESARTRLPRAAIHERILDERSCDDLGAHDLIVMRHVLEHLPRPVDDLKLVRRLLSESGLLYIEVPDVATIPPALYHYFHHEHLTYFSRETVEACLVRAKFGVLRLERFAGYDPGSGFAYPVLRVLAAAGEGGRPRNHPEQADDIWRTFKTNDTAFVRECLGAATAKLDVAVRAGKRLALFGAGPHTVDVLGRLEPVTYPWQAIFDNHPGKAGKLLCGIPIVTPTPEAFERVDTVLVSSLEFEAEMIEQMRALGGARLEIVPLYARRDVHD
jgi:SAM-dependent methyltransferase